VAGKKTSTLLTVRQLQPPDFIGCKIIENDDSAWLQLWSKYIADVGFNCLAIHHPLEEPWRNQVVLCQARDE
jgi:hypothetical protein